MYDDWWQSQSHQGQNDRIIGQNDVIPEFITQLRIETAKRLLGESTRSREEIASVCGFGSLAALERAMNND